MSIDLEQLLTPEISRPARYLGTELGAVHQSWDDVQVRWALTYPEIYEVGASNLGHIILYNILNAQPRQLCDRAYLPAPDLGAKLRQTQTPLFAVESRRALLDFDILGFSLSYELGATNILEMLDLAGIPLTWKARSQPRDIHHTSNSNTLGDDALSDNQLARGTLGSNASGDDTSGKAADWPLIFAGGQTATSNPEPYADFFDFIALGDGEELLPEIGLIVEEGKSAGLSREALLLDLAQVPGVYVPRFYAMATDGSVYPNRPDVPERILRRVATPIPAYSIGLVPYIQTVHDRLTIEIRRGCTRGCRFCQPGMLTRPARDVAPEQVIETIEQGIKQTGHNEFSLLSLSCSDYLALPALGVELRNRLKEENIALSLPSQRVDRFDETIAHIIGGTRKTGITFAPEAGTQRLRDIINKGLTNEELLRGVKTAYEQGWNKIKLYFMIGLPGETDVDVLGIAETVRWLRRECRAGKRLDFNITISNFTPKPHTPFQWHSVSTEAFKRKQHLLKAEFKTMKGIKLNLTDVRISAMEDFVGRGDRSLAPVIQRAWELGAGMDSWWENLDRAFKAWTQAIEASNLTWKYRQVETGEHNLFESHTEPSEPTDPGVAPVIDPGNVEQPETSFPLSAKLLNTNFLNTQRLNAKLPWDHLDTGIDKQWLQADLQQALEAATVPDCSFEGCSHCGVCGIDFGHNVVVPAPLIPKFVGEFQPNKTCAQRLRIWFGKQGEMRFLSHLDLMRLWERATRRAGLPLTFTGGFHPGPRIIPANALSLGVTSSAEVLDLELTRPMQPETLQHELATQLPTNLPLYQIEEVDLTAPPLTVSLEQAQYTLQVMALTADGHPQSISPAQWQQWIQEILKRSVIEIGLTTKSGKLKQVNLRERLTALSWVPIETLPDWPLPIDRSHCLLRYVGSCRNDGTILRPEHIALMLDDVAQAASAEHEVSDRSTIKTQGNVHLLHVHRDRLYL